MQECSICEKKIYGHPKVTKGSLVCGSCTLNKAKGGPVGRSMFDVRLSLGTAMGKETLKTRAHRTTTMSSLKIKSNFARDRVIMLDGSHPLKFDHRGEASCPAHLRDALDRLIAAKPNRFWIVEEAVVAAVIDVSDVTPKALEAFKEEWQESQKEEVVEVEIPKQLDLSYLTDEEPQQKKRGPKKKQSQD